MPTWYSLRNRLEAGEVSARNSFERFLTTLVTTYGCLDIWHRSVASSSSELECRIFYMQADDSFVATESWERDGERAEYWLQVKGTASEIRATLISLLPQISQLHETKRHGEWNYGPIEPFKGQGSITTDINGNVIISGRFGDIALYDGGVELNWEDIAWSFDGCEVTATAPPSTVCFYPLGSSVLQCGEDEEEPDPVGTCVRGDCRGYVANYPETAGECDGVEWIQDQDLSKQPQEFWEDRYNCEIVDPPEGTCVTGDCTSGFTSSYVEQDACDGIDWFEEVDLTAEPSSYWEDYYNCVEPTGCCILGDTCEWDFVGITTEQECIDAHAALPPGTAYSWNPNSKEATCNLDYLTKTNTC